MSMKTSAIGDIEDFRTADSAISDKTMTQSSIDLGATVEAQKTSSSRGSAKSPKAPKAELRNNDGGTKSSKSGSSSESSVRNTDVHAKSTKVPKSSKRE